MPRQAKYGKPGMIPKRLRSGGGRQAFTVSSRNSTLLERLEAQAKQTLGT
jgi:hypothetical protein